MYISAYFLLQHLYFQNKNTWFMFVIFVLKSSASRRFPILHRYRHSFTMGADTSMSRLTLLQCWDFLCTGWSRFYHCVHLYFPWKYTIWWMLNLQTEDVKPLFPSGFSIIEFLKSSSLKICLMKINIFARVTVNLPPVILPDA